PTAAAGYTTSAIRYPDRLALVDDLGSLTFTDVHRRTNGLAHALADRGIGAGDNVAVLCRKHRGIVDITVACSKLAAHALYLNTLFSGPHITEDCAREMPKAIVFDEEFTGMVAEAARRRKRFIAWTEPESGGRHDDEL